MEKSKLQKLKKQGWKIGSSIDFLGLSAEEAEQQLQYVRRKFRIVEARRYKKRKDVLGSDMDELNDIAAFFLLCSINKPRLEPTVTQHLQSHPEKLKAIPRKELEERQKRR